MRKTFVCLGACLLLASTALPASAQLGGKQPDSAASAPAAGGSGGGSAGASSSGGRASVGGGASSGGASARSGGDWSGRSASANRGNWSGRSGGWSGNRRWAHRSWGPGVTFGFGGWAGDSYAYDNCGWVRVKRIIRHRAVWHRVYRCY